jgi:hypothetical protein
MKRKSIYSYLKLITSAKAFAITDQQESKFVMFNDCIYPEELLVAMKVKREAVLYKYAEAHGQEAAPIAPATGVGVRL